MRMVIFWKVWISIWARRYSVVKMPPPSSRCPSIRKLKGENHKRCCSLESGLLFREKDDDLALFNEMESKENEKFLLQSTCAFEDTFSTRLRYFSDLKLGISIPIPGECSDLLTADEEKNDYDWLLTPPETPLFSSLDDEAPSVNLFQNGRPRSQLVSISRSSTMEKSTSSRGSASPNRLTSSAACHYSPTSSIGYASSSRRLSPPPSEPTTHVLKFSTSTFRKTSSVRRPSFVKSSRGNSASPKIKAWESNFPGFSSNTPPNLRTSLVDRPPTYVRGSSPASSKPGRQSESPVASRSISSSHSKGSIVSSGDDDIDSMQSIPVGCSYGLVSKRVCVFPKRRPVGFAKNSPRNLSSTSFPKRSYGSLLQQMDKRKSPQKMFRPLLSSVPSTTFYDGKATNTHRTMISLNSSITTSSNTSSDQGTNLLPDAEESDQNYGEATSNIPCHDDTDEVFAFEKVDTVNGDSGQDFCHQSDKIIATCKDVYVITDVSEVDSFVHVTCYRCGGTYSPVELIQTKAKFCPHCRRDESTITVGGSSTDLSMNFSNKTKSLGGMDDPFLAVSEDFEPHILADIGKLGCEKSDIYLQENSHAKPFAEESGTEISIVLNKSSSGRDHNVQARTFTATTLPYDDSSYEKDDINCVKTAYALSLVDLSSSRQIERYVQLQQHLCDGIPDLETSRHEINGKSQCPESQLLGISNVHDQNFDSLLSKVEYQEEETDVPSQEHVPDPQDLKINNLNQSFIRTSIHQDSHGSNVTNQSINATASKFSNHASNESSVTLCLNHDVSISKEAEGFSEYPRGALEVEISEMRTETSSPDEHVSLGASLRQFKTAEVPTNSSLIRIFEVGIENAENGHHRSISSQIEVSEDFECIRISEVEIENDHNKSISSQIDVSEDFESNNVLQESLFCPPLDRDLTVSIQESRFSDHAHGILEGHGRSLTLEEATDMILFCQSIVQDIAHQAACIASEKEMWNSLDVAILGKTTFDMDMNIKPGGKRFQKPRKTRQKRVEKEQAQTPSNKSKNDENDGNVSSTQNVGVSNKEAFKSPKLESKCNCRVM